MELLTVGVGIAVLLVLILRLRLPAFMALLIVSAGVGLALGMPPSALLASITSGMGNTLGFIAVVVGLGTMLGALLEFAGGVRVIAGTLIARSGAEKAGWALSGTGLLVGVAVFFDVAFVILVPLIRPLCATTGRHPMYFATPLLAGLIVGHAFIPPTPGPIAVAELLDADLGWVIVMGLFCGIPATIVAGPLLANRYRSFPALPVTAIAADMGEARNSGDAEVTIRLGEALLAILLPLALIVGNTVGQRVLGPGTLRTLLEFVGHPFIALLLACIYAYIAFGVSRRVPAKRLQEIMTRSLEPAGVVVLVTGAGGVFKQVLVDSGVGDLLGAYFSEQAVPPVLLGFMLSSLIRIAQGSATVAMITAAGLTAPVLQHLSLDPAQTALVVIAIAAGASVVSHVNDSGFWLVNRFLDQTEAETLRSWTVISTVAGVTGFVMAALAAMIL